jgi:hypothetical protein
MINVNGKEIDEHGLSAKTEARRRAGLYDPRMQELLERSIEAELDNPDFAMIRVIYDLHHALGDEGSGLEPPDDLSRDGEKMGRAATFMRRFQTRFIRAVNEGYVQQQVSFNTLFTQVIDISCSQIYNPEGGTNESKVAAERDMWLTRRPRWDAETAAAVAGEGRDRAVFVGIPGTASLESFKEGGRPVLAMDTCDTAVAEAQADFIPARYCTRLADVFGRLVVEDLGLMVLAFPECQTGRELDRLLQWAGEHLLPGGAVLVALNRGWSERMAGEGGFVRWWPRRLLERLMARHGFKVREWRCGEHTMLKGEKSA